MKPKQEDQKEMVGGCCVCSDENGWTENPLVYCDGQGCNVAVHQACYGIVTVPTGSWFCRKCESQERAARVRCELCPSKDGALKRTDSGGWAHVVCALYIPEVRFGNVTTMEPIMLQLVPPERFNKTCYICEESSKGNGGSNKAQMGACMQCNRQGCKNNFHVTCAQALGLLCEEAGNYLDNVKYCGYCSYHYSKLLTTFHKKGSTVKTIPPYRPVKKDTENNSSDEDANSAPKTIISESCDKDANNIAEATTDSISESKDIKQKKRSSKHSGSLDLKNLNRDVKPIIGEHSVSSKPCSSLSGSCVVENSQDSGDKASVISNNTTLGAIKSELKSTSEQSNISHVPNLKSSGLPSMKYISPSSLLNNDTSSSSASSLSSNSHATCSSTSTAALNVSLDIGVVSSGPNISSSTTVTMSNQSNNNSDPTSTTDSTSQIAKTVTTFPTSVSSSSRTKSLNSLPISSSSQDKEKDSSSTSEMDKEKDKQRRMRRNGSKASLMKDSDADVSMSNEEESPTKEGSLNICEEKNLSIDVKDKISKGKNSPEEVKLNVQFTPNVSATNSQNKAFTPVNCESTGVVEPAKRSRSNSQDRGRRNKRGGGATGASKRGGRILNSAKEQHIKEQQDSEDSSPESFTADAYPPAKRSRIKKLEIKDIKEPLTISSLLTNGMATNALLLGNQINPSSAVAQKMQDTLHAEIEAHSIYKDEEKVAMSLVGPALPGKRETSTPGSVLNSTQPPPLPQSLEQLLERQWEQGSQFLMEQAQHFDIASLLSCLHQLRQENVRLEETVNSLIARRDHLLAVNARLSVPLTSTISSSQSSASGSTPSTSSNLTTSLSSHPSSLATSIVSITPTGPSITSLSASALGVGHLSQMGLPSQLLSGGPCPTSTSSMGPSRPHSQGRPPSGGNISHPSITTTAGGRGTSPHDRRVGGQQSQPLENGLGEPEYRYRSPGSGIEHQHRQQSPMLPPGAQPSPTSLRQSPASSNYHSGTSPHTGIPSLSPSGVGHNMPPHTMVSHSASHGGGHHPIMVSSSHGPQHSVSLSRGSDHARAELVRLNSSQPPPHSNTNMGGYPVYQMVSPPVPGAHHSPVTMSQHPPPPSHTQVMRRETVVDTSRGNHSTLEKR